MKHDLIEYGDLIHSTYAKHGGNVSLKDMMEFAKACAAYNEICEFLEHHPAPVGVDMAAVRGADDGDDIAAELSAAEKYYRWWQSTGDMAYQTLGKDELRHAKMLIDKDAGKVAADRLQHYTTLHDQLLERLNGVHAVPNGAASHGMAR